MIYTLNCYYNDGESVNVQLAEGELGDFFKLLEAGKPWFSQDAKNGFWLNHKSLRFIQLQKHEQECAQVAQPEQPKDEQPAGC